MLGFSSLESHWDIEMVMRSLSIVARKYPELKLIMTGKVGKPALDLARQHGVERNIHLTGFLPFEDVPWYLGCADVFVLPFPDNVRNVGRWPNKIGDYMSLGRPTVSNPVGDVKSLFEENEIGLLADWDPGDFAEKILYLIEEPGVADRLGKNARRVAVAKYDWQILIGRLEDFYQKVLERECSSGAEVPAADARVPQHCRGQYGQ
jgi:glycosyltransferase involved in cell wall biosynthesis